MFLQLRDGGTLFAKPSRAKPRYELRSIWRAGRGLGDVGINSQTRAVHLLVVPSRHSSGDYDDAKDAAVDYVRFDLDEAVHYVMSRPDAEAS